MKRIELLHSIIRHWGGITIIGFLAVCVGCGGTPKKNELFERAQSAFMQAQSNPEIADNAQVPMHEAEKALDRAMKAEDQDEMDQASYAVERYVQLAIAQAEQKVAEQKMEILSKDNQRILLESRQREIEQARTEAEQKAREAEMARYEAERLRQEAEAKAQEAELARQQAEQALEQLRQLEDELSNLKAIQTERGLMLTLGDVLFESGKAELMAGASRDIGKLADFLKTNPNRELLIEGHTDSQGSDAFNLKLSQQRADAIRATLGSMGVSEDRITTKGYGKAFPIASNNTEAGRQQNRRVEIIILNEGADPKTMFR